MVNHGMVYKIINKVTGYVYIGQTTDTLENRFKSHMKRPRCPRLKQAVKTYGISAFTITPICKASNQQELNHREYNCIRLYKTQGPKGYNIAAGGDVKTMTDDTKRKIRAKALAQWSNPIVRQKMCENMRGKTRSKAVKTKLSFLRKGRKLSIKIRKKISEANKGKKKEVHNRAVYLVEGDEVKFFRSVQETAGYLGMKNKILYNRMYRKGYMVNAEFIIIFADIALITQSLRGE